MSVTLDLRLIDHEHIVVRGLPVVNDAIRNKDPDILRNYLATLPVNVDQATVDFCTRRIAKLRKLKAPDIIIQNEEQALRRANGAAYQPEEFRTASFDELRELLGSWCWMSHCYSLNSGSELGWFLYPTAGPDGYPLYPNHRLGDPAQNVLDMAIHGSIDYPKDDLGDSVVRTRGSTQPDCYGYNPPETVEAVFSALQSVDPDAWAERVHFRCDLYRRTFKDMLDKDITARSKNDLLLASEALPMLVSAYEKAVEFGYGVSCEFSL